MKCCRQAKVFISLHPAIPVCVFPLPGAAAIEYHRLRDLSDRNLFSHSSERRKSKIRVSAGLISSEASQSLLVGKIPLLFHGLSSVHHVHVQIFSPHEDNSHLQAQGLL